MGTIAAHGSVASAGHDAPIQNPEEDLLNGLSVARAIHRVLRTAPRNWSTRIGLYGQWGSGKTSILNLLRQLEERDHSIVLCFSAWAAAGESGVISLFYDALAVRLQEEGIKLPFKQRAKRVTNKAKSVGWIGRVLKWGAEILPAPPIVTKFATSTADEIASFAMSWSRFDKADMDVLTQQLSGRRVVVFVDDLDRADPKAVPKTLLALRELLDWPGFTFVLAFDKRVVSKALSEYSAAFGEDSQGFLEKVIDIPFEIPIPRDDQKKRLAESTFNACCNCIPIETVNAVLRVLPAQPRRIKLISRMLGALRPSLVRYDSADVDWQGLCLYQILLEASQPVADWIVDTVTDDEMNWMVWAGDKNEREKKEDEARAAIRDLLNGPSEVADANRIIEAGLQLLRHWDLTSSESVRHWVSLSTREPSITAKEFRRMLEQFGECKSDLPITAAIQAGSVAAGISLNDAANDLITLAIEAYRSALDAMAEARTRQEWGPCRDEALKVLGFLEYLWFECSDSAAQEAARQGPITASYLGLIAHWLAWTKNDGEAELRDRERKLALFAADSCVDPELLYCETDPFWDRHLHSDKEGSDKSREWRTELRALLVPRVVDRLLAKFAQPDGFLAIATGDDKVGPWIIENQKSPLYTDPKLANAFVRILSQGVPNDNGSRVALAKNARLYLNQILFQTRDGSWGGVDHVKGIHTQNSEIVPAAWMAVLECPVPYRMLSSLRKLRSDLIEAGVSADLLHVPDWLRQ